MKTSLSLAQLFPLSCQRYLTLPVFGPVMEDFALWLRDRGYASDSLRHFLRGVALIARWLQKQRVGSLAQVTPERLAAADVHFRRRKPGASSAARRLCSFLRERRMIPDPEPVAQSPSQAELERFALHMREVRGLAEATIGNRRRSIRDLLRFLQFDQKPSSLRRLRMEQIEDFLRRAARTNSRFSLQQIVAALRLFLRFEFAEGTLPTPLHEQIDTPRVYRLERLPRALSRQEVQAFLLSIDQSDPHGMRDFALLYLAAAYGLRGRELVELKIEDIDWRQGVLCIRQTKTKQVLRLPLSDEAGDILLRYLRDARPRTEHRELFLHVRAPSGPLRRGAVYVIARRHLRRSGLKLTVFGTHVLRHSLAIHLLREGVSMKAIGDTLGHRDATSTAIYLRLALGDLRSVGLPIPENGCAVKLLKGGWEKRFPRVRTQQASREPKPICFRSALGGSMTRYLALKRALGREYGVEERTLAAFDAFLHVRQWRARTASRDMFESWRESLDALRPAVRRKRLCIVRNYLAWHARRHPGSFVPELESFPKSSAPQPPRLVSVQEMASLLATASGLAPSNWNSLRAESIRLGLLLLFCCGLRCGELLRLKVGHFDLDEELLRIEATKFHKSRLAPLDPSVACELRCYLDRRRHCHIPTEAGDPLIWSGRLATEQAGYSPTGLTQAWKHLCLSARVLDEQGRPPRLHDLRHSFAVHALHRWYVQGVEVRSRLPHLATYMGHVNIASTHYYLQLTPSLGEAASRLFHDRFAELFQEGEAR